MKIVVFAGGVGTRLWPLSRRKTPKQFEKIIGDKSTLQETVERLLPRFNPEDIYIATGVHYKEIVKQQLPQISEANLIFEPEMRDVGPAIGLVSCVLNKNFPNEPVAILWSDHMLKNVDTFIASLVAAEKIIAEKEANFIFIAQKPRFANQNIGWIQLGVPISQSPSNNELKIYHFEKLRYRPKLLDAVTFFHDKNFVWNLGYFVTTPGYLVSLYKTYAPHMHAKLMEIEKTVDTPEFGNSVNMIYPTIEKISFDDAILEKLPPDNIFVISADLGWSDVGAWEALKEALSETENENVTRGKVMLEDCVDSLVFNYNDQLIVGIDLNEMLIIHTADVMLVCPKTSVPKIKKLVESLTGTPHEHLT